MTLAAWTGGAAILAVATAFTLAAHAIPLPPPRHARSHHMFSHRTRVHPITRRGNADVVFIAPPRLTGDPFEVDLGGECLPCAGGEHAGCDWEACTCCGTEDVA